MSGCNVVPCLREVHQLFGKIFGEIEFYVSLNVTHVNVTTHESRAFVYFYQGYGPYDLILILMRQLRKK